MIIIQRIKEKYLEISFWNWNQTTAAWMRIASTKQQEISEHIYTNKLSNKRLSKGLYNDSRDKNALTIEENENGNSLVCLTGEHVGSMTEDYPKANGPVITFVGRWLLRRDSSVHSISPMSDPGALINDTTIGDISCSPVMRNR